MRRAVLMLLCSPADVLTFALAFAGLALAPGTVGTGGFVVWLHFGEGWLSRRWRYSVALGHAVLIHPDHGLDTEMHEAVHVRQFEGHCCASWLAVGLYYGLRAAWGPDVAMVALAVLWWLVAYLGASLAAWLGGRHWYRGNAFEEHARAETYIGEAV